MGSATSQTGDLWRFGRLICGVSRSCWCHANNIIAVFPVPPCINSERSSVYSSDSLSLTMSTKSVGLFLFCWLFWPYPALSPRTSKRTPNSGVVNWVPCSVLVSLSHILDALQTLNPITPISPELQKRGVSCQLVHPLVSTGQSGSCWARTRRLSSQLSRLIVAARTIA